MAFELSFSFHGPLDFAQAQRKTTSYRPLVDFVQNSLIVSPFAVPNNLTSSASIRRIFQPADCISCIGQRELCPKTGPDEPYYPGAHLGFHP